MAILMASEEFISNLENQLCEVELLQSMFPEPGELTFDYPPVLDEVKRFIEGKREATTRHISFTIKIDVESAEELLLQAVFAHEYPRELPELYVSSSNLSRKQQKQLNDDLMEHVGDMKGELCVSSVVMWLQENGQRYFTCSATELKDTEAGDNKLLPGRKEKYTGCSRLWIYSHHIYRKELLKKNP